MPRPNLAIVTVYLPRDETPFHRCFRELFKGRAPSRCHHQSDAVVRQPAVDRFHQVRTSFVEEQTVRAQDHVVQFFRKSRGILGSAAPALPVKMHKKFLGRLTNFIRSQAYHTNKIQRQYSVVMANIDGKVQYRLGASYLIEISMHKHMCPSWYDGSIEQ